MQQNALQEAASLSDAILAARPEDPDALYWRGVTANRLRDHRGAIEAFRRAIALRPEYALAWLGLGNAQWRSGNVAEAGEAYREVVRRQPGWPDAHFNLGLVHRRQGRRIEAARSLHEAWWRDPMFFDAARHCVASIADCVRNGETATDLPRVGADDRTSFTVVTCSVDEHRRRRAAALYERLFSRMPHEIVTIWNPPSLAAAYNEAVARSRADVVVLSHDDVDVLADDFAGRLVALLRDWDAVGVVGSTRMLGPAVGWSGHPHLRGWITHRVVGETGFRVDVLHPAPWAAGIAVLDGVLIAARREVLAAMPFDAEAFDGFHLYDLDWSFRASQVGYRLGVCGQLVLVHASRGAYDARWQHYADRFCTKHGTGDTPPVESSFFGATLETPDQVRRFFAMLAWLGQRFAAGAETPAERQ